LFRLEAIRFW